MIMSFPLPVFSIYFLCFAGLCFYLFNVYGHFAKSRLGMTLALQRKPVNVIFLLILIINLLLAIEVFVFCRAEFQSAVPMASANSHDLLSGGSQLLVNRSYYVDTLSAWAVISVSFAALIIGLHAMADKNIRLTPLRVSCILLIMASVEGVYYSNSFYSMFFFILMSQLASFGLFNHGAAKGKRLMPVVIMNLSRIVAMLFLLAGILMLSFRYGPSLTKLMSHILEIGVYEKITFSLIVASLIALFLRRATNNYDGVYRAFFAMRTQAVFFVLARVLFSVFGALHGLEKIPNLLIFTGCITILFGLFMTVSINKPILFGSMVGLFMKGFLITAMGIAYNGCFSAEDLAQYGFTALEAMFVLWLLYLPAFSIVAITTVFLERKTQDGIELYKKGGLLSLTPFAMFAFYCTLFIVAGMPPFATYPLMQLLYRASGFVYPFLTVFLVIIGLVFFFVGLYTLSNIALGKTWSLKEQSECSVRDSEISLPVGFLILWFALVSFFPGFTIQKVVVPSVESLMNTGVSIDVIQEVGK